MSQKPREPPSVGQVLVTKTARLLCVGRTFRGCKFVNLNASTEVSDHSILNGEGEVVSFEQGLKALPGKPSHGGSR